MHVVDLIMKYRQLYLFLFVVVSLPWRIEQSGIAGETDDVYESQIKPLLKSRCYACHGALKQQAGLRLDAASLIQKGGDSGPAIIAGQPAKSPIVERVSESDLSLRMPPEGKPLTAEQIALLSRWIEQGAVAPADELPEADPREHWSFKPLVRPALPAIVATQGISNPVDLFLAAEQEKRELIPLDEAEKHVLLRRVYLDLIGLPPSRDELHEFLADDRDEAYERVVDRLLNSPQYGERWGRHWMDVWRYSDWYGRRAVPDVLNSYAQIWRWRDWIVRSLNEDKGYDRMVMEMLAADEIAGDDDANVVATGFLVRNFFRWNYNTWMKDNIEHTGKAFLGLSFNCCHCHDHKYDPLTQEEYFKFRAFFEPLELRHDRAPGEADPGVYPKYVYGSSYKPIQSGAIRIFDEKLEAQTFFYTGGEERNIVKDRPAIAPAPPALLSASSFEIAKVDLPPRAWYPALKSFVQNEELAARQAAIDVAAQEVLAVQTQFAQVQPGLEQSLAQAMAAYQQAEAAAKTSGTLVKALSGSQSLFIDATQGRRALINPLDNLKQLDDQTILSYRLYIIEDGHTDIQLCLDLLKGATGGWIDFRQGTIKTYRPGTFEEIEIGRYDMAAGQNHFEVVCRLQPSKNQMLLTVTSVADKKVLVDNAAGALNGWNKSQHAAHGLLVDVRTGTQAVYDDIAFTLQDAAVENSASLRFDFEHPAYPADRDLLGIEGWSEAPYTATPATSVVASHWTHAPELKSAEQGYRQAQRRLDAAKGLVDAAQGKLNSAQSEMESLKAKFIADRYRYLGELPGADKNAVSVVVDIDPAKIDELMKQASRAERMAKLEAVRHSLTVAQQAFAAAEILPEADAKRGAALATAQQQLTAATAAIQQAEKDLAAETTNYSPLGPQYPAQSTGRRTALAKWIANAENPLTARVAVNHIWLRHFGRGIVTTPAEFGRNGARPTHRELLDWLAAELIDNGWRMKPIHRLLVTSQAYCRKSVVGAAEHPNLAIDRDNVYLWRFNPVRMEAEVVRDSLLASAGELKNSFGGKEIEQSEGLTDWRRSIYFSQHGEEKMMFLDLFDAPDACDCYRRTSSVRPQQALALSNSELVLKLGRLLARRLSNLTDTNSTAMVTDDEFIIAAFEQVLSRSPKEAELTLSRHYLSRQRTLFEQAGATALAQVVEGETVPAATNPQLRARESFVQALFNHSDFVTIR